MNQPALPILYGKWMPHQVFGLKPSCWYLSQDDCQATSLGDLSSSGECLCDRSWDLVWSKYTWLKSRARARSLRGTRGNYSGYKPEILQPINADCLFKINGRTYVWIKPMIVNTEANLRNQKARQTTNKKGWTLTGIGLQGSGPLGDRNTVWWVSRTGPKVMS